MRSPESIVLALLLLAMTSCSSSIAVHQPAFIDSVDDFDWLAGHWVQTSADGSTVNEEMWLAPSGGILLGVNRTLEDGRAVFFEYLMVREIDGRIAYLAMPGGRNPPSLFHMIESSAGMTAIFENPEYDFPRRIAYQREGDELIATLTGPREGGGLRVEQWRWQQAPR